MMHALDVALSQLGVFEATGRNDGVPQWRYMRGDRLAWCMGFQLFNFDTSDDVDIWDASLGEDAGRDSDYWKLRNCHTAFDYLQDRGMVMGRNIVPNPNDLIFLKDRAGSDEVSGPERPISHVGIVDWTEAKPHTKVSGMQFHVIHTVEGNLGNKVAPAERSWPNRRIAGFARLLPTPDVLMARQKMLREAKS